MNHFVFLHAAELESMSGKDINSSLYFSREWTSSFMQYSWQSTIYNLQIFIEGKVHTRQWPEVSDFVARFCTLLESNNTRPCENRTRFACDSRMAVCCAILAWPCVVWLAQRAKMCDTNHIPWVTAYWSQGFTAKSKDKLLGQSSGTAWHVFQVWSSSYWLKPACLRKNWCHSCNTDLFQGSKRL